jgi:hypothetical protein
VCVKKGEARETENQAGTRQHRGGKGSGAGGRGSGRPWGAGGGAGGRAALLKPPPRSALSLGGCLLGRRSRRLPLGGLLPGIKPGGHHLGDALLVRPPRPLDLGRGRLRAAARRRDLLGGSGAEGGRLDLEGLAQAAGAEDLGGGREGAGGRAGGRMDE